MGVQNLPNLSDRSVETDKYGIGQYGMPNIDFHEFGETQNGSQVPGRQAVSRGKPDSRTGQSFRSVD